MNTTTEIFYRSLHSQAHREAWYQKHFNSYHPVIPHEWQTAYYELGCRDANKYPLDTSVGRFTRRGANNHILLASKYQEYSVWKEADLLQVCELDGVCAFRDPASVLTYLGDDCVSDVVVVEFEGVYVGDIPETSQNMSGVLVTHSKTLKYWTLDEFRKKHAK